MNDYVIAIDGGASTGKTTIAKLLAKKLTSQSYGGYACKCFLLTDP